ncbi:pyrroline-5-carboxylate reductase [Tenacibaculum caenipelagi]|uniref:Pyrroline-5-carboxylate reductase n=1 Tax=Tenacibaculum caenipelagi TaxID=1325435 RepID=A0A4R6TGR2_9FLAO|nr:pyrroline-5-carboxylate reductase [Tenacibaculum caenipelagi]TDQ27482.1 pyrroline-5-carboxylate reductase [Tenacibaculum caenipelagi]
MKIAIIGTGNLGKSIAKGLTQNNSFSQLFLTKRNIEELNEFKEVPNVFISSNNKEAITASDVLIFAVQPTHLEALLKETAPLLSDNHILISTITGFSIEKMESLIGSDAIIMRAMPNTAIAVGKSMTCICSNTQGKAHLQTATTIFNQLGTSMIIPESQMQAATVICASGIAFWMRLIRATTQAAIQLGFDAKEAQELAMHTSEGAANLLIATGNHPEEEIDKVTTPKGCTIEGLNEMEHKGLSAALIQGMVASFNKINTIKKEN